MKTLYRRWLIVGLSMSIFVLDRLRRSLESKVQADLVAARNPNRSKHPVATPLATPLTTPGAATTVTFSGTVIRDGGRFALRETAGVLYTLDSTGRAWPFEGEDVRVTGHFDTATSLLHVDDISSMAS
jgi:hypothetical protein